MTSERSPSASTADDVGARVLLVEDDPDFAQLVVETLADAPYTTCVQVVTDGAHALRALCDGRFDLVLLDRGLPDGDGLELLRDLPRRGVAVPVLVLTADASAESAVEALRSGAADYLVKSAGVLQRIGAVSASMLASRPPSRDATGADALVGEGAAMRAVRAQLRRYAASRACVLVEGETGVGKELVARALHVESDRAAGPFVPINCGALPEHLVESELFGHVRGAFTGAHRDHPGLVEHAERGTLFLDEVEDLPAPLQGKLLRLLQEGEYRPVGATRTRRADVRVVAASNADLEAMVRERRFRRDLFYRLDVLRIVVPPLRARLEDLPALVAHLARDVVARSPLRPRTAFALPSPAQLAVLCAHAWPGNVRELANVVERAAVIAASTGWAAAWTAALAPLGAASRDGAREACGARADAGDPAAAPDRALLLDVLERHRWRRATAARELGISRVTLWRRMRRVGLAGMAEEADGDAPPGSDETPA